MRARTALAFALAVVGGAAGCARGRSAPRGADATAPVTARCSFDEAFPVDGIAWTGDRATLARRGPASHPRGRLVADARDRAGAATEYLVDTGTSCAFLSARDPGARDATIAGERLRLLANEGATAFDGRDARLPAVDLGGLAARDVPVFLVDRPHSLHRPANVLGMAWMAGLSLDHDARSGAWSLRRGGPTPAGTSIALEGPGFPVVTVVDDAGRRVYALVDTGAPMSLYGRRTAPGRYRLLDARGATLLTITAREPAPWIDLAPRGLPIAVWIGLDDLARTSFTLDFPAGRWVFPASSPPATPR